MGARSELTGLKNPSHPRSRPEIHGGHTDHLLRAGHFGAYLKAKVVDNRVVQLEAWPYEFC